MVFPSQQAPKHLSSVKGCNSVAGMFTGIPVIDLSKHDTEDSVVKACQEFGFFKVINHGVPVEFIIKLEDAATKFFDLPQHEKEKAGPPDPFGYGTKGIGPSGDVGWLEYLLLHANPQLMSQKSQSLIHENSETLRTTLDGCLSAMKKIACEVLEMIASGLKIKPKDVFSRLLKDPRSDSFLRLNHYPSCPDVGLQPLSGQNLVGFGEHRDPQIISVLRSNNIPGLQICLGDGSWVSIPPDRTSFFINVGDAFQVMTNGRFKSVKHRVVVDRMRSRLSMIYFGGPPLTEKIAPLPSLIAEGEESLYKEFTWCEYKQAAYKSRLADYRLSPFEKTSEK